MLGVDTNATPKFKVVTDDKLIAKLCHMVIHYQWYTSTGILSMVLINFVLGVTQVQDQNLRLLQMTD